MTLSSLRSDRGRDVLKVLLVNTSRVKSLGVGDTSSASFKVVVIHRMSVSAE